MNCESAATLAAWLLAREFADERSAGPEAAARTIRLSPFQATAASRAGRMLERHGGVLIADSVGLGKTWIGIALIEAAFRRGVQHVLVTTPASIRAQWWSLLREVCRQYRIGLVGARGTVREGRPVLCWLSHTSLSRERWPASFHPDFTVVDEAHAFRNPRTRRYRALSRLCRNSQMVLLTATPINNSLRDLYWLLRLFLSDSAFAGAGVSDLRIAFAEAAESGRTTPPLDAAVASVTVRRTRHMVLQHEPGLAARFPRRAPPIALTYDVEGVVPHFFERLGESIASLRLDPLSDSGLALRENRAPAELIRIGLLKRLESSVYAFCVSLGALEGYLTAFAQAAMDGYRLRPREHRAFAGPDGGQLTLFGVALDPWRSSLDRNDLAQSALADAARIMELRRILEPLRSGDPKLTVLKDLLAAELGNRKVLVFTEYRDTATFLWLSLHPSFRVGLVHGSGARIGTVPASRLEAVTRFSPVSNGRAPPGRAEQIDVLIATDVLSEGLNLQDAADVVSYDLPWNPVRLIQRIGRVDRLGSMHECVCCWNFLPARGLESLLKLLDRLTAKLTAIRAIGQDSPVLSRRPGRQAAKSPARRTAKPAIADTLSVSRVGDVVDRLRRGDPLLFDELEQEEEGPFAILERARALASSAGAVHVSEMDGALSPQEMPRLSRWTTATPDRLPVTAVTMRAQTRRYIAVVQSVDSTLRWFFIENGRVTEDRVQALRILVGILEEKAAPLAVPLALEPSAIASVIRLALQATQPPVFARGGGAHHALVHVRRRILEALARERGDPDPALCARADRLLEHFGKGLRSGAETELLNVVRSTAVRSKTLPAAALLQMLETAISSAGAEHARPETNGSARVIAILELA